MKVSTYIYRKSPYHKLDARAKLLFTVLFTIALVLETTLFKTSIAFFFVLLLSFSSIGAKESLNNFKKIAMLVFFIIIFSPFQYRDGEAAIKIGNFMLISHEAIKSSLTILLKFISISFIFSLLLECERLEIIIAALRFFCLPYSVCLTISMTLSFIPNLASRYSEIKDAIALRLNESKRREGLMATLTALIVSAVKMIPESASLLEERGFTGKARSSYRKLGMSFSIFTQIVLSVIIPVIFIILR